MWEQTVIPPAAGRRAVLAYVVVFAATACPAGWWAYRLAVAGGPDQLPFVMLFALATGLAAPALAQRAVLHVARPYLLRSLPGRCRGCGYDLTGNATGTCPERGVAATSPSDPVSAPLPNREIS